jgi:hypothetical protein
MKKNDVVFVDIRGWKSRAKVLKIHEDSRYARVKILATGEIIKQVLITGEDSAAVIYA